jgi:hypothetical protein
VKTALPLGVSVLGVLAAIGVGATDASALTVTQTTDGTTLLNALVTNSSGLSGLSAAYTFGDAAQVGVYSGFTAPPVTIGNGLVLSTGSAAQTVGPASSSDLPSTDFGGGSTAEINGYAPGHVANWESSHDAAVVQLDFTLTDAAAVAFDFVFGSVEYPTYVSSFTDAVYVFLDGQQITFDSLNNAVQVGSSFASLLTTADSNSAFADPHGLLGPLTTTSGTLAAGNHTILFEVADTNDGQLDSALFLSNFRTTVNEGGPITEAQAPEPATLALFGASLAGFGFARRRRAG